MSLGSEPPPFPPPPREQIKSQNDAANLFCKLFFHVVLKPFTIVQHKQHFELPKQQFCWPSGGLLGSMIKKLWSNGLLAVCVNLVQFHFNVKADICLKFVPIHIIFQEGYDIFTVDHPFVAMEHN